MKSILKVTARVCVISGIVIGVLVAITLLAWVSWQVMPSNPSHDQWVWNVPPMPLAIAIWFVGIPLLILPTFVGFAIGNVCGALVGKIRKKPSSSG